MGKTLVTYFSAEHGSTKRVAECLAQAIDADLFEIIPEKLYSPADVKWVNPMARCNREKLGKKDVPVSRVVEGFEAYDKVFIGFPIWYGIAPNVVHTFADAYDWSGKTVALFATSGGSGMGKSAEKILPHLKGVDRIAGESLFHSADPVELKAWAESL